MPRHKRTLPIGYSLLIIAIFGSALSPEVGAKSYSYSTCNVKINIAGRQTSMSGVQAVRMGDWARFDIAIGVNESIIQSGERNPKAFPVLAIKDWESNSTHLTISVAVLPFWHDDGKLAFRIIQQSGLAPGLSSDDLNSIRNWAFTRKTVDEVVPRDSTYEMTLDDPLSSNRYKIILTVSERHFSQESMDLSQDQVRNALNNVDFAIQHILEPDSLNFLVTGINDRTTADYLENMKKRLVPVVDPIKDIQDSIRSSVAGYFDKVERVKSDRFHEVEFADVIRLKSNDSCYHRIRFALTDLESTIDKYVLFATLRISRQTICSPDKPVSSIQAQADKALNETYERRIRLYNGINTNIKISSEEDSFSFLPVYESFNITARW